MRASIAPKPAVSTAICARDQELRKLGTLLGANDRHAVVSRPCEELCECRIEGCGDFSQRRNRRGHLTIFELGNKTCREPRTICECADRYSGTLA